MRTALTIAGSDSGGGAGIQADLKTFAAFGVYGTSAITAVTAQNTRGVAAAVALDPTIVVAQIDAVASDFEIAATKIGMLANAAIASDIPGGVTSLMLVISFFGGLTALGLGIIGQYLWLALQDARARPAFVVRSAWSSSPDSDSATDSHGLAAPPIADRNSS